MLATTLKGIRRQLGDRVHRKIPITPGLLLSLRARLPLHTPLGASLWAAALIMFFGLLRRSNVLAPSVRGFDPSKHLRRRDFRFTKDGLILHIRWSKTNQFKSQLIDLPYPRIKGHPLCPCAAVLNAFAQTLNAPAEGPALVISTGFSPKPLTPDLFVNMVRSTLAPVTPNVSDIGGHSFRRGGATWAYSQGVPLETVRQLGGWASNAYTAYVLADQSALSKATGRMASKLPTSTTTPTY